MSETEERSRAERRLIRKMEKKGGKGFHVLRSAEVRAALHPQDDHERTSG